MSELNLRSTFGFFQWLIVMWNFDHTVIGKAVGYSPLLATAVVLGSVARWKIATLIATSWFLLNTLFAVFFCLTFDPRA
jgi:hypothetical protein